ncbi:MAG: DeoR/GlpR transcriptional regulator [Spirochaetes bacterium]|nr:DeoR/GlpR transcriptional regulator [Spirochaetota bacterium]
MEKESTDNILSSERRQRILEIVNQKRSISVDDLARYFPVSTITIRRDLDRLAEENLLRRVHGGAMALSNIVIAPKAAELSANITEEQKRIGKEASARIADGDFIIIESGSTCLALVQNLTGKKRLKVVSVSPRIVMALADISEKCGNDFEIVSSGGILNAYKNFFFGPHARYLFECIKVNIAFISVTAIDLEAGITADNAYEAEITRTILEKCAKKRIGLIYSSKFEKTSFIKVASAEIFDEIITGTDLSRDVINAYTDAGIKLTPV